MINDVDKYQEIKELLFWRERIYISYCKIWNNLL